MIKRNDKFIDIMLRCFYIFRCESCVYYKNFNARSASVKILNRLSMGIKKKQILPIY